ncbi:hypothetical protein [Corynebacterium sp. HS2168-gen11]|uniref:hypothetical protein n=1 Tax=Corynebacterium sp. HS2168-gen11 TaxID=2974027 RepID=UPI00216B05F0|nr:hypothetical protein [Corynebacterium sp. HS2168-gen11]MCS4536276.1 hypothetical protein [Corynebacterium sp. HS2168-gen11]
MRALATDINILIHPADWQEIVAKLPQQLTDAGYLVDSIHADEIVLSCEPDNMLVTQYEQYEGHSPITEVLHRVVIQGRSDISLVEATKLVVKFFPPGTYWYGTSHEGTATPGVQAACAWPPQ